MSRNTHIKTAGEVIGGPDVDVESGGEIGVTTGTDDSGKTAVLIAIIRNGRPDVIELSPDAADEFADNVRVVAQRARGRMT